MSQDAPTEGSQHPRGAHRAGVVVAVVTVSLAAMGFLAGTTPEVGLASARPHAAASPITAAPMPSYRDLRGTRRGPNAAMYADALTRLNPEPPPGAADNFLMPAPDRREALSARQTRRAFDGAPPTIPHPIGQRGAPPCLACHETGLKIGDKVAPKISHAAYQSCTQCHAVQTQGAPFDAPFDQRRAPLHPNDFVGLAAGGGGTRAWAGAPPTIPHATLMRSECLSCHGPGGLFGLRTPHPDRSNCLQCHAPAAQLDQRGAH